MASICCYVLPIMGAAEEQPVLKESADALKSPSMLMQSQSEGGEGGC